MATRGLWLAWTLVVLTVLMAGVTLMRAQAQGAEDLAALRGQVSQLYEQGKYDEALPFADRYVALAATPDNTDIEKLSALIEKRQSIFDGAQLTVAPEADLPSTVQRDLLSWAHCLANPAGQALGMRLEPSEPL
jgi:hypothetical protein